jgi:hypothetical protein
MKLHKLIIDSQTGLLAKPTDIKSGTDKTNEVLMKLPASLSFNLLKAIQLPGVPQK